MVTFKLLPDFPKYCLTSDGRVLHMTRPSWKTTIVRKDKTGFKYVLLSDGDIQKKVFLLALKFPRGEGYENVLRLKKKEKKKLKKLRVKARKVGRHHRSLKELRRSMQKYERRVILILPDPEKGE
jgi:hypothetical protein